MQAWRKEPSEWVTTGVCWGATTGSGRHVLLGCRPLPHHSAHAAKAQGALSAASRLAPKHVFYDNCAFLPIPNFLKVSRTCLLSQGCIAAIANPELWRSALGESLLKSFVVGGARLKACGNEVGHCLLARLVTHQGIFLESYVCTHFWDNSGSVQRSLEFKLFNAFGGFCPG